MKTVTNRRDNKRRQYENSWFNFDRFETLCKKMIEDKQDLTKLAANVGVSYSTIWTIRAGREPAFSVIAKLSEVTKIPMKEWVKLPEAISFIPMDQLVRGRKKVGDIRAKRPSYKVKIKQG